MSQCPECRGSGTDPFGNSCFLCALPSDTTIGQDELTMRQIERIRDLALIKNYDLDQVDITLIKGHKEGLSALEVLFYSRDGIAHDAMMSPYIEITAGYWWVRTKGKELVIIKVERSQFGNKGMLARILQFEDDHNATRPFWKYDPGLFNRMKRLEFIVNPVTLIEVMEFHEDWELCVCLGEDDSCVWCSDALPEE